MRRLLLVGLAAVTLASTSPALRAQTSEPSSKALNERALKYYKALEGGDIALAWKFFDPSIQRENPQDDFVKRLKMFRFIKMVGSPEVYVVREGKVPIGNVQTHLAFQSQDGRQLPDATHYTKWVWQPPGPNEPPDWLLLGGPIRTKSEGEGVQPPKN
jgi:hypothetical protein